MPPEPVHAAGWRRAVRPVAALLLLNGLLSFSTWWPTPGIVPDARLAPEFLWLWLALLVLAAAGRSPGLAVSALAAAYLLLVLGRYAEVTVPSLFGREINLYWDGAQIPRFLWVTAQEYAWWQSGGVLLAAGLLLAALFSLLRWGIGVALREAAPRALRSRAALALTAAAALLVTANYAGVQATWPLVSKPVVPTYWRQAKILATALSPDRLATVLPETSAVDAAMGTPPREALAGLRGRDVYLVMLESYGAIVYDDARAVEALRPHRKEFSEALAAGGHRVVSAFMRSPTFAGASDLAHLSVLSGIDLSDPMRHDLLLTTDRPTLVSLFRRAGYQTFGLYPAVRWEWPERVYYGFDVYLEGRDLGYQGPSLGYWMIPDQFSLARFEQLHPRGPDAPPRLLFFPTITSHLPFSPVPPYQSDWDRVLQPDPFGEEEARRALAQPVNWLDMFPDFLRTIGYTYRWLAGFLREREARETVYILVGDHQPAANVSGEGASWDVPVHIVSRDARLLSRFVEQGFAHGLEPQRAPLGGLHELTGVLLRAFGELRH